MPVDRPQEIVRRHIHSTSQLVWAIPVTIESFIIGITSHRYWYPACKIFREKTAAPKADGSGEMVYRFPEEIMTKIEDNIKADGHALGVTAWEAYQDSLEQATTIEEKKKVMQEMRIALSDPGEALNFVFNPLRDYQGTHDAYIAEVFELAITPGLRLAAFYQGDPITHIDSCLQLTHIFVCLPWYLSPVHETKEVIHPQNGPDQGHQYVSTYRRQAKNRASTLEIDPGIGERDDDTEQTISFIDPEYLQLTEKKVLRINHAIKVLELDVDGRFEYPSEGPSYHWCKLSRLSSRPTQWIDDKVAFERDQRERARIQSERETADPAADGSSISSSMEWRHELWQRDEPLQAGQEGVGTKDGVNFRRCVDLKPKNWPYSNHGEHGKLWQPQLMMKHQCTQRKREDDYFVGEDIVYDD